MQAISAPDSSTLKIGGGNQSYVKLYAHTTKVLELNNSGLATFTGAVTVEGGQLHLGKANTASGHINAKELMTFNIDTDNDDTNRYFAWYTNGEDGSGTELLKILETGAATFAGTITSGQIFSTGGTVSGHLTFGAGNELRLGTSTEFGLFYSSGVSNIRVNSGVLKIRADDMTLCNQATDETYITAVDNGAVTIYYDNAAKLRTASFGVGLDVMSGHQSEGIVRIGRYDVNTSRYHDIKSYVSSTAASNYLKFSLHAGTENTVADVMTLKGDLSTTFAGHITVGGGQVFTPGGVNLALNPNTGTVTVGGIIQASGTGSNTFAGSVTSGTSTNGRTLHGSKTTTLTENTFSTVLTVSMSNHTACYVKIFVTGDWTSHSSVQYLGEYFLTNGGGAYGEPGMIIREVDNTVTDTIVAKLVDPGGTSGNRNFLIQLKADDTIAANNVGAKVVYEVMGQYVSVS
jgi:hypothetical protein